MSASDRFGRPLGTCRQCLGPLDGEADCHACESCPRCKGDGSIPDFDRVENRIAGYDECPRCQGDGWISANGNPNLEAK